MSKELKKETNVVEEKDVLKTVSVKIDRELADTFKDNLRDGKTQPEVVAEFMQNYIDNTIIVLEKETLDKLNKQLEEKYNGIAKADNVINALVNRYLKGEITLNENTTVEFI